MDPLKVYINKNRSSFIAIEGENLDKLHKVLFEMVQDLVKFCDENNLTYYLSGGSALGTIRHKGFIPWDDDVDIAIPRKDYNYIRAHFEDYYEGKYRVEAPGGKHVGPYTYMKIRKVGTLFEELVTYPDRSNEVFLDIFPLEYAPRTKAGRFLQGNFLQFFRDTTYMIYYSRIYKTRIRGGLKKCPIGARILLKLGYVTGRVLDIVPLEKWVNTFDRMSQNKPSPYVVIPAGLHRYKNELFKEEIYFPPVTGEFEGLNVKLPHDWEFILKTFYGDYMQLPPEQDRAVHFLLNIKL